MNDDAAVDGNMLAGALGELLSSDVTSAKARCAECGRVGPIAETMVFDRAAGLVARCPGCAAVLMTLIRADDRVFLSLRGISFIEFSTARQVT